jgi:hypothetical protein
VDTQPQKEDMGGKIEIIPGNKRVLLVAPHGFMGNGTGYESDETNGSNNTN